MAIAIRMARMAITIISSMRVKPPCVFILRKLFISYSWFIKWCQAKPGTLQAPSLVLIMQSTCQCYEFVVCVQVVGIRSTSRVVFGALPRASRVARGDEKRHFAPKNRHFAGVCACRVRLYGR